MIRPGQNSIYRKILQLLKMPDQGNCLLNRAIGDNQLFGVLAQQWFHHAISCTAGAQQKYALVLDRALQVFFDIPHQANAVGVIADDFPIPKIDSVYRTGIQRIASMRCYEIPRLVLERQCHIDALAAAGAEIGDARNKAVKRRKQPHGSDILPGVTREFGVDGRRHAVSHRIAYDGVVVSHELDQPYSVNNWSERAKVQVRVMLRMSVSFVMSTGKAAYGAARCTMRSAASSSIFCPDERLISIFSTSPSALIDTVSCRLP